MAKKTEWLQLFNKIKIPLGFVALIWMVECYEEFANVYLAHYGVYPREISGLIGIIAAPLLHNDWEHLFSNSAPLLVLGSVMMLFYQRVAVMSFIIIYLGSGFLVWMFARPNYHIGASGVVYGLIAWVLWTGIFRRNTKSIILALITVVLYAGYEQGLLPNEEGVSWESHVSGLLMGIATAFLFRNVIEGDEVRNNPWADEKSNEILLLRPDTFEKTKQERIQEAMAAEEQRSIDIAEWQRLKEQFGDFGEA